MPVVWFVVISFCSRSVFRLPFVISYCSIVVLRCAIFAVVAGGRILFAFSIIAIVIAVIVIVVSSSSCLGPIARGKSGILSSTQMHTER